MLTPEKIRLRSPLPQDAYEALKAKPRKLKAARLARPALLPGHPLPLNLAFWDDTPQVVREATALAARRWNEQMRKHGGQSGRTFQFVGLNTLTHIDLMVGTRHFDLADPQFEPVAFGQRDFARPYGTPNEELGNIRLYWCTNYQVLAGRIFVPDDTQNCHDLSCILAHELGHGLLLGHDPVNPWRLMYRHSATIKKPKPKECRWAADIWSGT